VCFWWAFGGLLVGIVVGCIGLFVAMMMFSHEDEESNG